MTRLIMIVLMTIASLQTVSAGDNGRKVITGAERIGEYLPLLEGRRVSILSNQTGIIGDSGTHLLDTLLALDVNVVSIMSPEHGFRGEADAGEHVKSSVDSKTGIPIRSLYEGNTGKPSESAMKEIDVLVFAERK